jgi:hypothetical protein
MARAWHRLAAPKALPEPLKPSEGEGPRLDCAYTQTCLTYAVQSRWSAMHCGGCAVRVPMERRPMQPKDTNWP